ncbi:MerR family transcriptional regulator [Enterococcus sp. ALS3]|uniref:MerR family transcriptional regulator n=1 Tax=Enterococcus alishanensis TaxID=1303817 RepID=A0ABS6TG22_9ENTE|nr:MerR family transcriptional regulator [Enterococcus alishanensis]
MTRELWWFSGGLIDLKKYSTSEVARAVKLHPNTIRKYEEWQLIPAPLRQKNGYRIYTEYHIQLIQIARIGFSVEIIHGNLRKKITEVIHSLASYDFQQARKLLTEYFQLIETEQSKAEEAIRLTSVDLQKLKNNKKQTFTRKQAADYLDITIDTLRNWELNGLITVPRQKNHYRSYDEQTIALLKIIRTLRNANYSLSAILRFMQALEQKHMLTQQEIQLTLNRLSDNDYIHSVCDTLLISLENAENNAILIEEKMRALENIACHP